MPTFSGLVTNISARRVNTKWGEKAVYDIEVDGIKFGYGFKDPTPDYPVGTGITGEYSIDKYGNKIDPTTVKKTGATVSPTMVTGFSYSKPIATTEAPAYRGKPEVGFPLPVTSSQISIVRQNALTNARELVMRLDGDIVAKATGAADAASLEAMNYVNLTLEVARVFADYSSGRDVMDRLKKLESAMGASDGTKEA